MSHYSESDTICAETTPRGRGGVSMIRLSGVAARKIAASLFDRPLPDPGCFKFGRIIVPLPNPTPLDDVVLSIYAAPHSYTGEDVVEISTHGSPVIVAELLEALYQAGARPAEPGEFTLRAYLQGRIDLTQAEAVSDLINSASLQAARSALTQLEGGIGKKCDEIATLIERLLILTELELDFVEEDVELSDRSEKISLATSAVELALNMLAGYQTARRLREGVKVVLTGAPNVGKSSLYNALIGDSRAIVHATPGTTRDVLSAKVVIGGIEFEFFDTAGLRDQPDEIEDEGIARARIAMKKADIILEIDSADIPGKFDNLNDINHIRITNKSDLGLPAPAASLPVSAQTGAGMNELRGRLLNMVQEDAKLTDGTISRERHYLALTHAIEALRRGREGVLAGLPAEMIAEEWRESLFAIDELSGKKRLDDLLNTIFARFCIGK